MMPKHKSLLLSLLLLGACAGTGPVVDNSDPWEGANRKLYAFNDALDRGFFKPLAKGYVQVTPTPVRTGVSNFFANLGYLNVVLNSFLQGKLRQGSSDTARFLMNSTLGVGGLFDVATPVLPKHDEDFGQTLAHWGMAQGAYLNLPLFGPNTVRKTPDLASSTLTNPLTYVGGAVLFPVYLLNAVNTRARLLDASELRDESALDPYTFTREAWLQQRRFLIYDGRVPLDDELEAMLPPIDDESSGTLRLE